MHLVINIGKKDCAFFFFFLYVFALLAFNLGYGFDWIFVRVSFVILIIFSLLVSRGKVEITSYLIWCLVFWAFYFLSLLWAHNRSDTLQYSNVCVQILGMAICFPCLIENRADLHKAIFAIIMAILGTVIRLVIMTPLTVWGTERLGDAIGTNSNVLGMALAFGALLSIYMFHRSVRSPRSRLRIWKMICYICLCVLFGGVSLFTGSRKTIIIIVIGITTYEILRVRGWKTLLRVAIVAVLAIAFLYFVFNNSILYPILGRRLASMLDVITGTGEGGHSIIERNFYIRNAMELFSENPIFGYGGNNFMTFMREIGYSHVAYSHNNYTELLSTLGITGFVIYYSYWVVMEIQLIRSFFHSRNEMVLLFAIIIIVEFVLDYWLVSYVDTFNQILFLLAIAVLRTSKVQTNIINKTKSEIQIQQNQLRRQTNL